MEKYLAPEAIGEGELSDQWLRFKREFAQFLVAVGKEEATEQVKLSPGSSIGSGGAAAPPIHTKCRPLGPIAAPFPTHYHARAHKPRYKSSNGKQHPPPPPPPPPPPLLNRA